jgi:excisionase family DNA binding protein
MKQRKNRRSGGARREPVTAIAHGDGRILVTGRELAVALGVSLRTVERMVHDDEIKAVWVRGAQRFHVPDVLEALRGGKQKYGRRAGMGQSQSQIANSQLGISSSTSQSRERAQKTQRTERTQGA